MGLWGGQSEMMWDTGINVQGRITEGVRNWVRRSRLSEESGTRGQVEYQKVCQLHSECRGDILWLMKPFLAGVNSSQWPTDFPHTRHEVDLHFAVLSRSEETLKCHQAFGLRMTHDGGYTWHRMVSQFPQPFPQWVANLHQQWQGLGQVNGSIE